MNLSKSSLGGQEDFPEPEEVLAKPNVMEVVTKLIKNGGLSKFISAGKYPASMNEPFSEHHRRAQMAEFFYLLDKVYYFCSFKMFSASLNVVNDLRTYTIMPCYICTVAL